jgi:glutamyl-tRNA synthetase
MSVRVRFAPSPTGYLHVGGARTALFNWLHARKTGGTFILRIEDTDAERSTEASYQQILESLQWLGIQWDEGPFRQSDRMDRYRHWLRVLEEKGALYRAFETEEELEAMRTRAMREKRNPIYDRRSLQYTAEEVRAKVDAGVPWVYRFRVPDDGVTKVPDTLQGEGECLFRNSDIGDFIVTRPGTHDEPGMPLYNFCCAIDDHEMGITHIIRGVEHLSNAARQILILNAMGAPVPTFTHLPLVMRNGKKMSKREGDGSDEAARIFNLQYPVSVSGRRDRGYLPEATINFISLLGWSFDGDSEIITREDMIARFSLDRLTKSNANFDEDKYLFINGWWIRNLPKEEIVSRTIPFLEKAGFDLSSRSREWIAGIIALETERCKLLTEFADALRYFFEAPADFDPKGESKVMKDGADALLAEAATRLSACDFADMHSLENAIKALAEERQVGLGRIAQPIRLAVSGRTATPGLFEVLHYLGKDESLARIARFLERRKGMGG